MKNEFDGLDFENTGFGQWSSSGSNGAPISGTQVLAAYEMDDVDISFNFSILCIMTFVYRVIFYVFLRFFQRGRK